MFGAHYGMGLLRVAILSQGGPLAKLPTGTVTFLFTDIEGSTRLLQELGPDYGRVQTDHLEIMRDAITAGGGVEIRTEGDAFFAVFPSATGAVAAAVHAQRGINDHGWSHGRPLRVRMGMHTGEGRLLGGDYLGIAVNRAARIAAAGHGGQVLLSESTRAVAINDLPNGVSVRDLGAHQLKDFPEATHLYDLVIDGLMAEFPPIKTLEIPSNLPSELTSFVGRERELEAVENLLRSSRVLTLTGPGGSGKTRLALRVASDVLDRFPDGVFFIELASIRTPDLVPSAIASALRKGEEGSRSVLETLAIELRNQRCLLVLDNFEHVIEASPAIGKLVRAASQIRVLVTSRSPLRIQGEHEFAVPPLELPDRARPARPEEVTSFEALTLFVERAMAIDPSFALSEENSRAIAEICLRLDGLPLAIELAASRLRLLSPSAMLERLDRALPLLTGTARDLPARQRSLRVAIDWSYDLLAPEIAALFRRICVFAGGFTIAAAERVGAREGELRVDILNGLDALLDASLVRRRSELAVHDRFETLQTIREYGLERLEEGDEAESVRHNHAHYFLEFAEATEHELRGSDLELHLEVLRLEHDNLRAALAWALEHDEGNVALRISSSLWRFWHLHGDLTEGRSWTDQALALPSAAGRTRERARALIATGSLAYWARATPAMAQTYEEAMAIFRELEDPAGIALATLNRAFAVAVEGRIANAAEMSRASRAMFEEISDPRGVADSLFALSGMSRKLGDLVAARAEAEEALRLHKDLGDIFGIHGDLYVLGRAVTDAGDLDAAREIFLETLSMAEHMGSSTGLALSLDLLAVQDADRGNPVRAMKLAGASAAIKDSIAGEAPPELLDLPDSRERARALITDEEIKAAWDEGRAMSVDEALAYARESS
jgi:predicted ATPase/class 3 adenylate cyclase